MRDQSSSNVQTESPVKSQKRQGGSMPAPVTPIKKQLKSSQGGLGAYASGSMISISDSPSARYRNSPA